MYLKNPSCKGMNLDEKKTIFSPPNKSPIFYCLWNTAFLQAVVSKGNSKRPILVIKFTDLNFGAFLGKSGSWREKTRSCSELSSRRSFLFKILWRCNRKTNFLIHVLLFQASKWYGWITFKSISYSVTKIIMGAPLWHLKLFTSHLGALSGPLVFLYFPTIMMWLEVVQNTETVITRRNNFGYWLVNIQ